MHEFRYHLTIAAPPGAVLDAFFDPDALAAWWQVRRSLCIARPLGSYAVEWDATEWRDEVFGRLGGTFRGTVVEFKPGLELFVADAYWLPPDSDPLGPMAFEVTCTLHDNSTLVRVRQSSSGEGPRWTRYYAILGTGLPVALEELKRYLENRWSQ